MDKKKNKNKPNKFTSAMGDLKGLLDKEGINLQSPQSSDPEPSEIPTLHSSDIDFQEMSDSLTNELLTNELISSFEQSQRNARNNNPEQTDQPVQRDHLEVSENQPDETITDVNDDRSSGELPILDGTISIVDESAVDSSELDSYISDMEDDNFELLDFANSVEDLEKTVESITEPEHLLEFEQNSINQNHKKQLQEKLQEKLSLQIEQSIDELKAKLLASITYEIEQLFKK